MQAAAVQILAIHRCPVGRRNQLSHSGSHRDSTNSLGERVPRRVALARELHHHVDSAGLELLVPPLIWGAVSVVTHDDRARLIRLDIGVPIVFPGGLHIIEMARAMATRTSQSAGFSIQQSTARLPRTAS